MFLFQSKDIIPKLTGYLIEIKFNLHRGFRICIQILSICCCVHARTHTHSDTRCLVQCPYLSRARIHTLNRLFTNTF